MDAWYRILSVLNTEAAEPAPYGIFHLCGFALAILIAILLCRLRPEGDERFTRRLLLTVAIFSLIAELYRQVHYGFSLDNGQVILDYRWYIFPFQFCSTPMYAALLAALPLICSSAESSIVMIRSSFGMKSESAFKNVVLPRARPPAHKKVVLRNHEFL